MEKIITLLNTIESQQEDYNSLLLTVLIILMIGRAIDRFFFQDKNKNQ
ncbi:hypothetical protein [Riemerella anatipestifer]|nr:hypothetical protein [Riemerella anatipestifer]MBT0550820.1 hypothetical protein [Riemerella anatipestifer]MBT0553466.1 hypothetical protein [Riemerella anatipestifer]MCE3024272.1 hypothetical protein [Riemerella anatipestifer]MCU7559002.1 hypothetical protein [Riemerella anatipestifer]MDY3448851.1 hypothetical protein [Riemerella anatipestifer]